MEMTFARSGGFAGAATGVTGRVTFASASARVTGGPSYERDLSESETQELRDSVMQASINSTGASSKLPDGYQFDARVVADDGSSRSVTLHDEVTLGNSYLLDWVRQECDRIWRSRTEQLR